MTQKKDMVDSFFDFADKIVDGATTVLKDVPEPDEESEEAPTYMAQPSRIIEVHEAKSQPLLKSGPMVRDKQKMREVVLGIKNVSRRRGGGVSIIAETPTHELVAVLLSEEDWKKVYDAADWMRMVEG